MRNNSVGLPGSVRVCVGVCEYLELTWVLQPSSSFLTLYGSGLPGKQKINSVLLAIPWQIALTKQRTIDSKTRVHLVLTLYGSGLPGKQKMKSGRKSRRMVIRARVHFLIRNTEPAIGHKKFYCENRATNWMPGKDCVFACVCVSLIVRVCVCLPWCVRVSVCVFGWVWNSYRGDPMHVGGCRCLCVRVSTSPASGGAEVYTETNEV